MYVLYTGCNSEECTSLLHSYVIEMYTLRCYTLYVCGFIYFQFAFFQSVLYPVCNLIIIVPITKTRLCAFVRIIITIRAVLDIKNNVKMCKSGHSSSNHNCKRGINGNLLWIKIILLCHHTWIPFLSQLTISRIYSLYCLHFTKV